MLSKDVKDIREDVKHRRKQEITDSMKKGETTDVYAPFMEMANKIRSEVEAQRKAKLGVQESKNEKKEDSNEEMKETSKPNSKEKVDVNKIIEAHVASSPWLAQLAIADSETSKLLSGVTFAFNKWQKPFMNTCNLLLKKAGNDKFTSVSNMLS